MGIILKRANDLDSMLEELFLITTLNYKKSRVHLNELNSVNMYVIL